MFVKNLIGEKMSQPPSSYAEAGIDLHSESEILKNINHYVRLSFSLGNVVSREGHYANLIKFGDFGLALTTDGVGSKVLVAQLANVYDTVGIDCVAMNVNDLLAMGIMPAAFVDYLAVSKLEKEVITEIIKGVYAGCKEAGIPILGGELATLPEIITGYENSFDLAGTALGIVKLSDIVDGTKIAVDDIILGIRSSGLHSNGYTLARKVLFSKYSINSNLPWGEKLSTELLKPTRIYVKAIKALLEETQVHGLAHITGSGFKKLHRLTNLGFDLEYFPPLLPIFEEIQQLGKISSHEMFSTFNMGIGFIVIVPKSERDVALDILNKYFETVELGRISNESSIKIRKYDVKL